MELLDLSLKYWPLIVALIAVAVTWAVMRVTDKDHERRITANEVEIKAMKEKFDPVLVEIRERLAGIEATLKFLTNQGK
jgi:type VI protein secretion system component VasK